MASSGSFLDQDTAAACIHCGLCLSSCPTYLETGNENDSPRGRIYLMRALDDGTIASGDDVMRHIDLCLGCRACEAVCPSGVRYGDLLESTRSWAWDRQSPDWRSYENQSDWRSSANQPDQRSSANQSDSRSTAIQLPDRASHSSPTRRLRKPSPRILRFIIEQILPYPWRLRLTLAPARLLRRLSRWLPLQRFLPRFAREMLALLPGHNEHFRAPLLSLTEGPRLGTAGFVSGCVMQTMFGGTNAATIVLINGAGYDVATPREQVCCGALYAHGGNLEGARENARTNIAAFEQFDLEAIVVNAGGAARS